MACTQPVGAGAAERAAPASAVAGECCRPSFHVCCRPSWGAAAAQYQLTMAKPACMMNTRAPMMVRKKVFKPSSMPDTRVVSLSQKAVAAVSLPLNMAVRAESSPSSQMGAIVLVVLQQQVVAGSKTPIWQQSAAGVQPELKHQSILIALHREVGWPWLQPTCGRNERKR